MPRLEGKWFPEDSPSNQSGMGMGTVLLMRTNPIIGGCWCVLFFFSITTWTIVGFWWPLKIQLDYWDYSGTDPWTLHNPMVVLMFFGLFWMFFDNPVYLWCFDAWWWSVCVLFNIYIYILYNMCIYIYNHWLLLFCFFIVIHPLLMVPRQKPLDITGLQSSPTGCVSAWSWRQWLPGDRHSCASAAWRCGNVKLGFNEHADLTDLTDLTIKKLININ